MPKEDRINEKIELAALMTAAIVRQSNNQPFLEFLKQNFLKRLGNLRFVQSLPHLEGDDQGLLRRTDSPWDMPLEARDLFELFELFEEQQKAKPKFKAK